MSEKLLRQLVRQKVLSEASMLVTYEDGTEDEFSIPDRFAKSQVDYMQSVVSGNEGGVGYEAPSLSDDELDGMRRTLSSSALHPDQKINDVIEKILFNEVAERKALETAEAEKQGKTPPKDEGNPQSALELYSQIIDAPGLKRGNLQSIRRIIATFSMEDARLLRSFQPGQDNNETKLSGPWAELQAIQQGREGKLGAVGQGEVAIALLCKNASMSAGAAHDITIAGVGYHVKHHSKPAAKSGLPTAGQSIYVSSLSKNIDALTFTIDSNSSAAKLSYTEEMLKNDLKNYLSASAASGIAKKHMAFNNPKEFTKGRMENIKTFTGITEEQHSSIYSAINDAYYSALGGASSPVIISAPGRLIFGTVGKLLYYGQQTSATPRAYADVFGSRAGIGSLFSIKESKELSILRSLIRESILLEELTKADKKEIDKLIKKGIEKDRTEQKKLIQKELEAELKKSLGQSFFRQPGKIRKTIEDVCRQELAKEMKKGSNLEKSVVDVTKKVLSAWHELLYKQQHIIQRVKI